MEHTNDSCIIQMSKINFLLCFRCIYLATFSTSPLSPWMCRKHLKIKMSMKYLDFLFSPPNPLFPNIKKKKKSLLMSCSGQMSGSYPQFHPSSSTTYQIHLKIPSGLFLQCISNLSRYTISTAIVQVRTIAICCFHFCPITL